MRIRFVVFIIAFCFGLSRLTIPIDFNYDRVFIRIIFKSFDLRILNDSFRTSTKGNYTSGCLLTFLDIRIRTYSDDYTSAFILFSSDRYVRFCFLRELKRTNARMSILVSYPTIERAMALSDSKICRLGIEIINGIPVRHFLRIRRSDKLDFKGNVPLSATTFNYHRFSISVVVNRTCLVVTYVNTFIVIKRLKIGTR